MHRLSPFSFEFITEHLKPGYETVSS